MTRTSPTGPSGRAAAVTVDHCLTHRGRDTSADRIGLYNELWHEDVAPNAKVRLLMTELMYFASNDRYDRLLRDLQRLDEDTLSKANGGSLRGILSLIHREDIGLLAQFARHRLSDDSWDLNLF